MKLNDQLNFYFILNRTLESVQKVFVTWVAYI